jgi:hypothetical protein
MSHTYWDPKGMMKKRPGGHTYHGGNTVLSAQYKDRYIPNYDPKTTLAHIDNTSKLRDFDKSANWNTFQKRTWYQDNLDHTTPQFEDFPGVHAEWRNEADFDKSYRQYNSKFVYDFRINKTTVHADGTEDMQQMRTADHTEVTKLRKQAAENERFDVNNRTVDFNLLDSPPKPDTQPLSRQNSSNLDAKSLSRQSSSEVDVKFFNQPSQAQPSLMTARHPAINPKQCRENPKDTFRQKEHFPLFWTESQRQDFRENKSSTNLLDTTVGRTSGLFSSKSNIKYCILCHYTFGFV